MVTIVPWHYLYLYRRMGPDEVAQVAAFALSRAAYWLKGVDIPIDGGMGAFNLTDRLGLECLRGQEAEVNA